MGNAPPAGEPSNRWPWIVLFGGVIIIVLAAVIFFFNRANNSNVNINVSGTPSPIAAAGNASPGPPPTLVPPTLPASASPAPTPSPPPSPSPTVVPPTAVPSPTPLPAPPTPVPAPAVAAPASPSPLQAAPAQPTPASAPTVAAAAPAAQANPSPTVFSGQVSGGGGLGNTRSDIDAAYGAPTGQTATGLVVFRKNNFEYHVGLVPDLNGRAALIVEMPTQPAQLPSLQQAQAEAHRLLPHDAQPPNPTPEGNNQFVVERYTSQTLAQALPAQVFSPGGGVPGSFLIVYLKDASGNVSRWMLGPGNDPNALIAQAG